MVKVKMKPVVFLHELGDDDYDNVLAMMRKPPESDYMFVESRHLTSVDAEGAEIVLVLNPEGT